MIGSSEKVPAPVLWYARTLCVPPGEPQEPLNAVSSGRTTSSRLSPLMSPTATERIEPPCVPPDGWVSGLHEPNVPAACVSENLPTWLPLPAPYHHCEGAAAAASPTTTSARVSASNLPTPTPPTPAMSESVRTVPESVSGENAPLPRPFVLVTLPPLTAVTVYDVQP